MGRYKCDYILKKVKNMSAYTFERDSLKNFIRQNKDKIYETARNNTKYNTKGQAVISKDDPSFNEDVWDEHFKRMDNNK